MATRAPGLEEISASNADKVVFPGAGMKPGKYMLKNLFMRLAQKEDPWADMWRNAPAHSELGEP